MTAEAGSVVSINARTRRRANLASSGRREAGTAVAPVELVFVTGKAWTHHVTRPIHGVVPPPPVQRTSRVRLGAMTRADEVLAGYADLADSMCACKDAACARAVDGRFQAWATDVSNASCLARR
jgi:hypothetical protein